MGAPTTTSMYGEVGVELDYNRLQTTSFEHASDYQDYENNNLSFSHTTMQSVSCSVQGSSLNLTLGNNSKTASWIREPELIIEDHINLIRFNKVRDTNNNNIDIKNCHEVKLKDGPKKNKKVMRKKVKIEEKEPEKKSKSNRSRAGARGGEGGRRRGGEDQLMRRPRPKTDTK